MIDRGIDRWPDEVILATKRFKQGHLLATPPFFYAAAVRYGIWILTRAVKEPAGDVEVIELDPTGDGPSYGLITTQTCDINEQRAQPRQPWLQVAPVYRWEDLDHSKKQQVEKDEVVHLVALAAPNLPTGFWVADLRIELPVEKSYLVGREPIEAFVDEGGYLRLAERLAGRRLRPALANSVSDQIVRPLKRAMDKLSPSKRRSLLDPIEELRLSVAPNRLQPTSTQLTVIAYDDPPPNHIVEWFDIWWVTVQRDTEAAGVALIHNRYTTMEKLSARDYASSVPLDFRYLSPDVL